MITKGFAIHNNSKTNSASQNCCRSTEQVHLAITETFIRDSSRRFFSYTPFSMFSYISCKTWEKLIFAIEFVQIVCITSSKAITSSKLQRQHTLYQSPIGLLKLMILQCDDVLSFKRA